MKTQIVLAGMLIATTVFAGTRDVAIYVTRMGGDSATAQPYVDRFLRYVESVTMWPVNSMKGSFLVNKKEAMAYINESKPGIGMLEPPLFFELKASVKMEPILQVLSEDLVSKRLHLIVKDPGIKTLDDLKGKRLWTTLADYPRYLSRVVLDNKVDATTHFTLKQVGQALKGVRGVLRGDCDATLVDDEQLTRAKEMTGGQDLRVIFTSPELPPIPVVVFGEALTPGERETLKKALLEMCEKGRGAEICKEMHIGKFVPLDSTTFGETEKRFNR